MTSTSARLSWGVKATFRQYVTAIPDGRETVSEGAFVEGEAFSFPLHLATEGEYRFQGRVDLTGYNGLLAVQVQNPWLHISSESWWLTVVDPAYRGDLDRRIRFCTLGELLRDPAGGETIVLPAHLDPAATRIFDDVYVPGTRLDDIMLVLPTSHWLSENRGNPRVSA